MDGSAPSSFTASPLRRMALTTSADGNAFDIGTVYTVTATVKKHGEYKGQLQMELTRVKVVI